MLKLTPLGHCATLVEKTLRGFRLNGVEARPEVGQVSARTLQITLANRVYTALLLSYDSNTRRLRLQVNGKTVELEAQLLDDQYMAMLGIERNSMQKVSEVRAPMPGLVRKIHVRVGQSVQPGDALLVLEAMKMENILKSPAAGDVAEIVVQENAAVEKNAVLIRFG